MTVDWLTYWVLRRSLCCPECAYNSKNEEALVEHAVENHPKLKASHFNVEYCANSWPSSNLEELSNWSKIFY